MGPILVPPVVRRPTLSESGETADSRQIHQISLTYLI
jgi:hypothetical protein